MLFKVNAPPPAFLPDGVHKNDFLKNRDAQLSTHRLTLPDQWKEVVHNVFESLIPILPEPKTDLPEEFQTQILELKADHAEIKQSIRSVQIQVGKNSQTLRQHTHQLEVHTKQLHKLQKMETTLSDQHELSKEMFAMLKELSSNKQDPEYKVSNQPHEAPPMMKMLTQNTNTKKLT